MSSRHDTVPDNWPLQPDPDQQPPDNRDPADDSLPNAEPVIDVPAGLIGAAIELLDLCDELFNRPGNNTLDTSLAAVIGRYQRANVDTLRWFHDGLANTAGHLCELLEDQGIAVEPQLHDRHGLLYYP
jgi:hypothetical protein